MASDVRIDAHELAQLGARLKAAGRGDLRKSLLKGIRDAAKPIIPDIRQNAQSSLPRHGGLAAQVAKSRIGVRTSLTMTGASVRIVGTGRYRLNSIEAGRLRHPVFGNRSVWAEQSVPQGWFTDPIEADAPAIRRRVADAVADATRSLTRGL